MARPLKEGLDYFPLEVDFFEDEKVQFVSARFGVKGDGIVLRLLCKIYRQGYAIKFDDDVALLFARSVGDISLHGLVKDVVNELIKRGFFNEDIFNRFGLLTSKGIQKRYVKICKDANRIGHTIDPQFNLLLPKIELPPDKTELSTEETQLSAEFSTKSKVKESKVKKSIEESAQAQYTPDEISSLLKFREWITKNAPRINQFKQPLTDDEILRIKDDYHADTVKDVFESMQNRSDLLRKNLNANKTFRNWAGRQFEKVTPKTQQNEPTFSDKIKAVSKTSTAA